METVHFYHALKIAKNFCTGCTHCMNVCPTSAIRVKDGTAKINKNACVDCGECLNSCPVNAIVVEQDDFTEIFNFKQRVALLPTILLGQFPNEITEEKIYSVIHELGFTHIYEVDDSTDIIIDATNSYIQKKRQQSPFISSFCPAIIRLIQVRFPSLVDHIIKIKPAVDISAQYYRKKLLDERFKEEEIGIFYITPCAAKIAAIKSPVGENKILIDGVINMDFIYNKVLLNIKQRKNETIKNKTVLNLSDKSIGWTLTNGEASQYSGRCLAIDEIHNVIEVLEKLENDEISGVDFLELRACDRSCAGGVLTTENRFLAIERLHKRKLKYKQGDKKEKEIEKYRHYLTENISTGNIEPRSILSLDSDMVTAMKKMKKINRIMEVLPKIDCGACGAPRCRALAEDVAQGKAKTNQCVFLQKMLTKEGLITPQESFDISEETWGKNRFEKKNIKNS